MYKRIIVPVDNSIFSDYSLEMALCLVQKSGAAITGFHVYAAGLHQQRFHQLEATLPQKYRGAETLERQRQIHQSLIHRGLELISRSYLEACARRCQEGEVSFEGKVAEGKNYAEIIREASNGYDLVVMGAKGLGSDPDQPVGSVCLRTVRRIQGLDVLVIKDGRRPEGTIMAALDGSPNSRFAFRLALALGKRFAARVEAVAVYDPAFHQKVFDEMVGKLTPEASEIFPLEEQGNLHRQVIDQGMARLYQEYLQWAEEVAKEEGISVNTTLLKGKPGIEIARLACQASPSLLLVGRYGAHQVEGMDIGSTAETLLLISPCNLLITANGMHWIPEAQTRLEKVPQGMMRQLTRQRVEEMAKSKGERAVTPELMEKKYRLWADGSAKVQAELTWSQKAGQRMERVPEFIRGMAVKAIEDYARRKGASIVTPDLVDEAKAFWEQTGTFHLP